MLIELLPAYSLLVSMSRTYSEDSAAAVVCGLRRWHLVCLLLRFGDLFIHAPLVVGQGLLLVFSLLLHFPLQIVHLLLECILLLLCRSYGSLFSLFGSRSFLLGFDKPCLVLLLRF